MFPQIARLKIKISKNRQIMEDERTMIITTLTSFCHWKTLCLQNRREKQFLSFKTTVNWLFSDIWCYLVIVCFDWKIGVFQQKVVRVYCIFNLSSIMVYYKDCCFFLCFKEILSLQHKFLHLDKLAWTLFMCTYYLNSSISVNMGVHWTYWKGWRSINCVSSGATRFFCLIKRT